MNIKEASLLTGISRDMLRHYEKLGILFPARNPENGYRDYTVYDLNDAVMIRQYSNLGISLQTLAHLSRQGGIGSALNQFQQASDRLEMDLELIQSKLDTIREFYHIFDMLREGRTSETGYTPKAYYYPRSGYAPYFAHLDPAFYGAIRMVFRLKQQDISANRYPDGQGFLSLQPIPSCSFPYIEIPSHRFWRTVMEEEREGFMCREKLLPLLDRMEAEGFHLQGDIMLSQILSATEQSPKKLICIECDIGV